MTRWYRRLRSPVRPVDELCTEAQIDLRDGLLEARADRIAELEQRLARTQAELATYKTRDFMQHALRLRRRQAEAVTAVVPAQGRPR
jgi:hypothetical protein